MTPLSDQEYFSKFLRERFEGKKINVFQLAGDASARKYYRIHVGEDQTFVLMAWEPFEDPESYPFLNVLKHFSSNSVQVPKCISYSKKEGLVLLEDLGDLT
jgi:aminoglycoside/choline kinase family phosphotransferase